MTNPPSVDEGRDENNFQSNEIGEPVRDLSVRLVRPENEKHRPSSGGKILRGRGIRVGDCDLCRRG